MNYPRKIRLSFALALVLTMVAASFASTASAQDDPPVEEPHVEIEDGTSFGGGGGGEPADVPDPVDADSAEEDGVSGAASLTRTLTRTKKITGAAFGGPEMSYSGGCWWPTDGNTYSYADVTGIPTGATITELFAEVWHNAAETELSSVNLYSTDGDGAVALMAGASSAPGGYVNISDNTITNPVVTGLGGSGKGLFLRFDADNADPNLTDHRVCQVWITYTVTESYLSDVMQITPITPCAEWDTRPGQAGYTASEGGVIFAGTTRTVEVDVTGTCGVPGSAEGIIASVFLINQGGTNWLNVYDGSLPNNNEAVIVGSPADALESVSIITAESSVGADIKVTMGGSGSAHAKMVITGYYTVANQPSTRYTD